MAGFSRSRCEIANRLLDNSAELLAVARNKTSSHNVQWIYGDAATITLPNTVDAAICMWSTINELPMGVVAKNLHKLVKPGGILILDNSYVSDDISSHSKETGFVINLPKLGVVEVTIKDGIKGTRRYRNVTYKMGCRMISDTIVSELMNETKLTKILSAYGFTLSQTFYDYRAQRPDKPKRFQPIFARNP